MNASTLVELHLLEREQALERALPPSEHVHSGSANRHPRHACLAGELETVAGQD